MFGSIYWGELKKAFRLKTVIIMGVLAIVGIIVMSVVFVAMNKLLDEDIIYDVVVPEEGLEDIEGASGMGSTNVYTKEDVESELAQLYAYLEEAKKEREKDGYAYYRNNDYIYSLRSEIAVMEYIRDNELYDQPVAVYWDGGVVGMMTNKLNADTFITAVIEAMFILVMIYGAIVAGSIYADEYKQGTIKLLLLRPVSRNQLTTAKLLASLTHVTAAYFFVFLLTLIAGYAAFPAEHMQTLYVFNASSVTLADNSAQIGYAFIFGLMRVISYTVVAFAMGAMTRNKIFGIITPILLTDLVGSILRIAGLARFFITDACDWMKFVGIGSTLVGGSDFFISIAVWVVYMAGLIAASYLVVDKKDVV